MSRKRKEMWRLIAIALGFFVLSFATYGISLNNKFIQWDDGYLIVENPIVHGISLENIKASFSQYDPELYIPVTFLSYQIDHLLWGMNPFGFHLTNLVLHTMNALLVFVFVSLLLNALRPTTSPLQPLPYNLQPTTYNLSPTTYFLHPTTPLRQGSAGQAYNPTSPRLRGASLQPTPYNLFPVFCGLLFLVHPLHTEAVAWASARKDVLSSFFFLLSVCGYLLSLPLPEGGTRRWGCPQAFYWGSVIAFALGLMSKVSIVVLPIVLLLIDWFQGRNLCKKTVWIEKIPYVGLSVVFGIIALFGKSQNAQAWSMTETVLIGSKSTIFYLAKLFWPTNLSPLYPYTDTVSWTSPNLLVLFVLVIGITVLSIFVLVSPSPSPSLQGGETLQGVFALSWLWYLILLLPTFTNFRKGQDIELDLYFASDRYAYLPSITIILLIALTIHLLFKKNKSYLLCLGILMLPLLVLVQRQSQIWSDDKTFFSYVVDTYPNAHIAHINVGILKMNDDPDGAIEEYEKAIAIRQSGRAYYNLGLAHLRKGRKDAAFDAFATAVEINPLHARAYLNLGVLLVQKGKRKEGMQTIRKAIEAQPNFSLAHENLGVLYEEEGKFNEAKNSYEKALQYDPESVDALIGLANVYINTSQLDKALVLLKHAIEIDNTDLRYQGMLERIQRMQ